MLVSPTEPKVFQGLGKTSSTPERYGVDFLWVSPAGLVGVQRKELKDLVSSLHDGRLAKELGQMTDLDIAVLVVEGRPQWTTESYLLAVRNFTQVQFQGLLFSIQMQGVWYLNTDGSQDTYRLIGSLEKFLSKERHGHLRSRPKANGAWGTANNRVWGIHLLQSFRGIGAEVAGRIYDEYKGVPLQWTTDEHELQLVKGVGRIRAERMIESLRGE